MARSWSVIFARALTTTTGCSANRWRTMAAARSMASASWTEVPPNFMTIIGAPGGPQATIEIRKREERPNQGMSCDQLLLAPILSTQVSLRAQKLAVQNGCAGGATDGVVGENREFPVEDATWTQASNHGRHALAAIPVQPRLGPVRRAVINHRLLGSGRKFQFLRQALVYAA